ncbi:MAG TPA: hypothetical protein VGN17_12635 [Bryobacteraceae bacterium]
MRYRRFILPVVLLCGVLALSQTSSTTASEVRGKKVVDDALAALGGQKFLTMQDRVETGRAYSFYRDELNGLSLATIYTRYIPPVEGKTGKDLSLRERQAFGKNEELGYVLFRENGGWEVNFRGPKKMEDERLERYQDSTLHNVLYIFRVRLHEPGLIFESKGADVVENAPVEIVDITDSENRVVTVYFHQSTKLPVRQVWVWRDPKTKDRNEEVTRFARYRDVGGGIQWPMQITRERNGEKVYQIFSDSVAVNQNLADDLFAVPTGPSTGKAPVKKKK